MGHILLNIIVNEWVSRNKRIVSFPKKLNVYCSPFKAVNLSFIPDVVFFCTNIDKKSTRIYCIS